MSDPLPCLGVVVVTFNASDVILDCLESLLAARDVDLRVVVVDNASSDDTVATLRAWASGQQPYTAPDDIPFPLPAAPKPVSLDGSEMITLVEAGVNGGFAAGVNIGLSHLAAMEGVDHFWVLNPDSVAASHTPAAYAACAAAHPGYGLMGGRTCYLDPPERIQMDGGTVNRWTGVTGNLNLGATDAQTPCPTADQFDFITGANVIASRRFYEEIGPMPEDYFLYYEEVDWAARGAHLPRVFCDATRVYHRTGTAIGSPTLDRIASPFSMYFKYRGRMRFVARTNPVALPVTWAYAMAKAAQITLKGARAEARALVAGACGLKPPRAVADRLSPEAAAIAFGRSQNRPNVER